MNIYGSWLKSRSGLLDRLLNGMDEKELIIIEGAAEGIREARETEEV